MLARMAKACGYTIVVIDCFADMDTCRNALQVERVDSLELDELVPAITNIKTQNAVFYCVYGSGFEKYSQSLQLIAQHFIILGNSAIDFRRLNDKKDFFRHLRRHSIYFPEVRFVRPTDDANWLVKPLLGVGGQGIRHISESKVVDGVYWQQFQSGISMSALFVADGRTAQLIGFNRLYQAHALDQQEYLFSGAINQAQINESQQQTLLSWLNCLTRIYALKGINSMDFIYTQDRCYVLEINPRPCATMALYDAGVFAMHIQACKGEVSELPVDDGLFHGYRIIYAQQPIDIRKSLQWPSWSMDIPPAVTKIYPGQPICSIIAAGETQEIVLQKLQQRENQISNQFTG